MTYVINPSLCKEAGECAEECALFAIIRLDDGSYWIDPEICTDCGACAEVCPEGAIK